MGGLMETFGVYLKGRFQSPLVGTIDANGKTKLQHLGEPPVQSPAAVTIDANEMAKMQYLGKPPEVPNKK